MRWLLASLLLLGGCLLLEDLSIVIKANAMQTHFENKQFVFLRGDDRDEDADRGTALNATAASAGQAPSSREVEEASWTPLAQARAAGIDSRAASMVALGAIDRVCLLDHEPTTEAKLALALTKPVLVRASRILASNKTQIDYTLELAPKNATGQLALASAALNRAHSAINRLFDVVSHIEHALWNGTRKATCAALNTFSLHSPYQYETSDAYPEYRTLEICFAILGGIFGIVLMSVPPSDRFMGSRAILCLSMMYAYGMLAYLVVWYAFDMENLQTSWQTSSFWHDWGAVYAISLAGGVVSLIPSVLGSGKHGLFSIVTGVYLGFGAGMVLGLQINTIGVWMLKPSASVSYYTLTISMSVVGALVAFACGVAQYAAPSLVPHHFAACLIGSYLVIKMIGVLVDNYPNEYAMYDFTAETVLYVVGMWLLFVVVFTLQYFFFHLSHTLRPVTKDVSAKPVGRSVPGSSASSASGSRKSSRGLVPSTGLGEREPLLYDGNAPVFGGARQQSAMGGELRV